MPVVTVARRIVGWLGAVLVTAATWAGPTAVMTSHRRWISESRYGTVWVFRVVCGWDVRCGRCGVKAGLVALLAGYTNGPM